MKLSKTSRIVLKISIKMTIYLFLVALIYYVGLKGFAFGQAIFSESGIEKEPGREVAVSIPEGSSSVEVGKILEKNGLIKDYKVFLIQGLIYDADYVPGDYTLNTSDNPEDLVVTLSQQQETTADTEETTVPETTGETQSDSQ